MKRTNPTLRVSGVGVFLQRLSRGCFAGAYMHRTSTTRTRFHGGLLQGNAADCMRWKRWLAS